MHGESLRASLVAVIVPNESELMRWGRENGFEGKTFVELTKEKATKELLLKQIQKFGRGGTEELKGFELPKNVYVESEMFTVTNELLTSTFKLKRHEAKKRYEKEIEAMYAEIKE